MASNRAHTESSKTSHANKKIKANDGSSIKSSLSSFDGASRKSSLLSSTDKDSSSSAFSVSAVKTVPPFLVSLHSMLCDKSHSDIISWNVGKIIIHKRQDLEKSVLGKYYNHSKFASFTRQLNRYGFENDGGIINAYSFTHKTLTDDVESVLSLQTLVAKAKTKEIVKIDSDSEGEEKSISDSQVSESIADVQAQLKATKEAHVRERNRLHAKISRMRKSKYTKGLEEELAKYKKKEMGGNDVSSTDDTAGDERPVLNVPAEERRKQALSAAEKRRELSTASAVKPATSEDVIKIDSDSEGEDKDKTAPVKDSSSSSSQSNLGSSDESQLSPEEIALFKFLDSQEDCIMGNAVEFGAWIMSQGIGSISDLKHAVGNDDYLTTMTNGNGSCALMAFKRDTFKLAVSTLESSSSQALRAASTITLRTPGGVTKTEVKLGAVKDSSSSSLQHAKAKAELRAAFLSATAATAATDSVGTDDTAGDERPALDVSAEDRRKQALSAAEKRRELPTVSAVKPATSDASLGEDDERFSGDESAAKRLKRVSATEPAAAKDGDSAGIVSKYSAAKDCDNNELPK